MPRSGVGTASTPSLATTNFSTSMRRWRMTNAATVDTVAEERSVGWIYWQGNAEGLGGITHVNRLAVGRRGIGGSKALMPRRFRETRPCNCQLNSGPC